MSKPTLGATGDTGLLRVLGPWMGTAVVIGTVIGSGVFKKPYAVAKDVPEFGLAMLAWVLVGLLALIGSLALAEIAVLFPRAGGNYVFLREAFGRWAGFLFGWVEFWIIRSASIAALATIFTESLHAVLRGLLNDGTVAVLPYWGETLVTVAVILVLGLVNARGTAVGGALQLVVTTVKVLTLVIIAVLPFIAYFTLTNQAAGPSIARLDPIWPADFTAIDWSKFGAAMVGVIWAYHGWMNIAPIAEEIRDPGRNIPFALIAGTLTLITLYLLCNLAYHLVVDRSDMIARGGTTPVAALFFLKLLGNVGLMLASAAIMVSVFGALNGNLLVGPRLLLAMGRDGLAPGALAQLHPRYRTPVLAGLTLTGWSILLVVGVALLVRNPLPVFKVGTWNIDVNLPAGADAFDVLTDYAMFGAVSFETLAVSSLFAFRRRYPRDKVELPYRCPLYPVLPIAYVMVMAAVLFNMFREKRFQSFAALGFIAVGALVYWLVFARRGDRAWQPPE
jgi:basic amino acid/polyamine antiporter, APA family